MTVHSTALLVGCVANTRTWQHGRYTTRGFTLLPIYEPVCSLNCLFLCKEDSGMAMRAERLCKRYRLPVADDVNLPSQSTGEQRGERQGNERRQERGKPRKEVKVDKKREEIEDYWWQACSLCAYR